MNDGIFTMTYRGVSGDWGMGLLMMRRGTIAGADTTGIIYDGRYTIDQSSLTFQMVMKVPPGVALVQGVPAKPTPYNVQFNASVPLDAIEKSTPVLVQLPPGPVNVILKRLRSLES
jgi:hypothetical protein